MPPASEAPAYGEPLSEQEKVESWRLHVLIEAGYPLVVASALAVGHADLHRAVEMLEHGCTVELAAQILL